MMKAVGRFVVAVIDIAMTVAVLWLAWEGVQAGAKGMSSDAAASFSCAAMLICMMICNKLDKLIRGNANDHA